MTNILGNNTKNYESINQDDTQEGDSTSTLLNRSHSSFSSHKYKAASVGAIVLLAASMMYLGHDHYLLKSTVAHLEAVLAGVDLTRDLAGGDKPLWADCKTYHDCPASWDCRVQNPNKEEWGSVCYPFTKFTFQTTYCTPTGDVGKISTDCPKQDGKVGYCDYQYVPRSGTRAGRMPPTICYYQYAKEDGAVENSDNGVTVAIGSPCKSDSVCGSTAYCEKGKCSKLRGVGEVCLVESGFRKIRLFSYRCLPGLSCTYDSFQYPRYISKCTK